MGSSTFNPSYIYQTPSGYIFRLRVPMDIKSVVGRVEFRYSLRAGALRVAKHRARCIASFIHELIKKVRKQMSEYTPERILGMVKNHVEDIIKDDESPKITIDGHTVFEPSYLQTSNGMRVLSSERIEQLTIQYLKETLGNDEKCRVLSSGADTITLDGMTFLEGSNMKAEESCSILKSVTRWLLQGDHSLMHPLTEKILTREKAPVDPASETYKVLSRELLKGFQSVLQVRTRRSEGDYSVSDEELVPALKQDARRLADIQQREVQAPTPVVSTGIAGNGSAPLPFTSKLAFTEIQNRYITEIEKGENWTEKTKDENLSIFALFVRAMGDLDITSIDRKVMSEYKSMLMQLPPNLNKGAKYQGMDLKEIIAQKPPKTLTVNTLNKYMRRLSGVFNYAVRNGYMPSNPAEGIQIKSQKRADQEREAYNTEDLQKLFDSEEYKEGTHRASYAFWTPYIALYSGCRLEEICQLHLADIRQEGGVWVFDINNKEEKKVKTRASARLIPIHPHLIQLGLLEHVETLKTKGETRLFPELSQRRDGYGQTVSKWFQRYKERCGIGEGKTFHSFRHTYITHLKHKQVDSFMLHELDGHTIDSETMGRYGKRYTPDILLREAIEKIDYGLDLRGDLSRP